jgi:hypothetical protein
MRIFNHDKGMLTPSKYITSKRRLMRTKQWAAYIYSVADPDSGSGAFLTPGSGIGKKMRIRIRDEQPGTYFPELRNNFLVKILEFFDADPRSGMAKIQIRDPG